MAATASRELSQEEEHLVLAAFRRPRGWYSAERAGQLSGVPSRTLYDWAKEGVLPPDYAHARPKGWSYRDLVFVRLLAWLRQKGMERSTAAQRIWDIREIMADSQEQSADLRSDGAVVLLGDESFDRWTGQQVFEVVAPFLGVFNLLEPIAELGRRKLWGPDLLAPSEQTTISPWAMGGEPVVRNTRIPTSGIYALHTNRGLDVSKIVALYPACAPHQVGDAITLESRLRQAA